MSKDYHLESLINSERKPLLDSSDSTPINGTSTGTDTSTNTSTGHHISVFGVKNGTGILHATTSNSADAPAANSTQHPSNGVSRSSVTSEPSSSPSSRSRRDSSTEAGSGAGAGTGAGSRSAHRSKLFKVALVVMVLVPLLGMLIYGVNGDISSPSFDLEGIFPTNLWPDPPAATTADLVTNRFYRCYRKVPRGTEIEHNDGREAQMSLWLQRSADAFAAADMPYHLNRGILLAWYRDCDPDFGGADIDVEIFHEDFNRTHLSEMWNTSVPNGSWIIHYPVNEAENVLPGSPPLPVQDAYRLWSTIHMIDIWIMHKMDNFWWISNLKAGYYWWFYPFKLAHGRFLGVDFLVPEPPICYLLQLYGSTWNEHAAYEHNKNTSGATWGEADYYSSEPPRFNATSDLPPRFHEDPQRVRECYEDPRPFLKKYGISEEWVPDSELPDEYVPPPKDTDEDEAQDTSSGGSL